MRETAAFGGMRPAQKETTKGVSRKITVALQLVYI